MYDGRKILGIIPARGGSKRLPGKNIKLFSCKPLITWTIEAAMASRYLDRVILSTEDPEISKVSEAAGVDAPFVRPVELATDTATSVDVMLHAYRYCLERGEEYRALVMLQPTSPLRLAEDIDAAVELFAARNAQSVISVTEDKHHWWTNTLGPDGCMKDFLPQELQVRSQKLAPAYRLNGAVYVVDTLFLESGRSFFGPETYAYVMDRERSIDIDDDIDFLCAESILSARK